MAFPTDMVYLRYDFNFNVDSEIQTFGIWGHFAVEDPFPTPDWQDIVDAVSRRGVESWTDVWGGGGFSPSVAAVRCIAYHYDQPLKEVLDRGEYAFTGDNAWSGTSSSSLPSENSVVLSLYAYDPATYVPQRARKRGRVYLPTPGASAVDGTGRLTTANQTTYVNNGQAWLNELTGSLQPYGLPEGSRWRPYVVSRTGTFATIVSHVRAGQVVDTQRRRRNKLSENYLTLPVNTP